ncbi:MAG: trypsin-like peptidase domain-containing protein, partial [Nitrospirota bacterium]|nr:trypsin-like peptidase domain-containing protein [Nitrospirota bacterium]
MKKSTLLFIVIIALLSGYLIGSREGLFTNRSSIPKYTYNLQLPKGLTGDSAAFTDIVKVISPLVVNIASTKTVTRKEASPFSQFFDEPFNDFMEPFNTPRKWKEQSLGSGVLVSPDGYILTNSHVVEKADEIKVKLYDQQDYDGKIIGTDPKTDIAVIKISAQNLPAINWGNSDNLQVGEFVLAFGNPYSLG